MDIPEAVQTLIFENEWSFEQFARQVELNAYGKEYYALDSTRKQAVINWLNGNCEPNRHMCFAIGIMIGEMK